MKTMGIILHVLGSVIISLCTGLFRTTYCQEDKPILKPQELVNLIIKEQIKKEIPAAWKQQFALDRNQSFDVKKNPANNEMPSIHRCDVIEEAVDMPIENKKVWSRWSKWGACSVSCGTGAVVRRRVCVAGRCAPGEREEQRRLCSREPCQLSRTTLTMDELHEQE